MRKVSKNYNMTVDLSIKTIDDSTDVMVNFPVGDTIWTMDNMIILEMNYDRLLLSIHLPENSVNIVKSYPHNANATVG